MASYIARRRRWWSVLRSLDSTISMSESILGGLPSDQAGLSALERNAVLTSAKHNLDADETEKALSDHHHAIHLRTCEAGTGGDRRMNERP